MPGERASATCDVERRSQQGLISVVREILERRIDRAALASVGLSATIASLGETTILVVISLAAIRLSEDAAVPVDLPFGLPLDELGTIQLLGVGFVALGIRLAAMAFNKYVSAHVAASTLYRWRRRIFLAFQNAPWETQVGHDEGYLQTITQTHVARVSGMVNHLAVALTSGISFATFVLGAFVISPVGALGLMVFGVALFVLLRPVTRVVSRTSTVEKQAAKEYARLLGEASAMTLENRVLGSTGSVASDLDVQLMQQVRAGRKQKTLQGLTPQIYTGLGYVAILFGLGVATRLEISEIASLGAIVLMMLRSIGYGQLFQSTTQTVAASRPYAAELVETVKELESCHTTYGPIDDAAVESIELRSTTIGYRADPVADKVNLKIQAGESIGIVGPSGGGKSTLALTLLGLLPPIAGRYLINGVDSANYSLSWWQQNISFVPQDPALFDGTVRENIAIHRPNISESELLQAAADAHLEAELDVWPGGLSHPLGPRGNRVSGGQRQRICIARALAGKPTVLILDEPTSALDVVSESSITDVLRDLRQTCTMIVVAHRLSTLAFCDRVFLVDEGRVIEVGSGAEIQDLAAFFPDEDSSEAVSTSGPEEEHQATDV